MKINCFLGIFFLLIGLNATAQTTKTLYTPTCAYSTQPAYTTTTIAIPSHILQCQTLYS